MPKGKPAAKPAAKPPAKGKGKGKDRFTWKKGDIVISQNGQLPSGVKPIKPPKSQPAPTSSNA
jgi:hypothetical protein